MRCIIEKQTDPENKKSQRVFSTCVAGKHRVFKIQLEKKLKYGIIKLTELPGANNTWDQAER